MPRPRPTTCTARRALLTAFAAAMIALAGPGAALAAEIEVNVGGDSGDGACDASCTLRDAVLAANASPDADTIRFSSSVRGTITLSGGELPISEPVAIAGPGPGLLTISGDADHSGDATSADSRIFAVDTVSSGATVSIGGLALTRGYATGSGGAIATNHADLSLVDITVSESATEADGGAVHVATTGRSLAIEDSAIFDNAAAGNGGAIALAGPAGGSVTISNSTLAENAAAADGGALYSLNPSSRPVSIANTTVAANAAGGAGGGIFRSDASGPGEGTVTLSSSIVADNAADSGPDLADGPGAGGAFEAGFSLIEDATEANLLTTPENSNRVGVEPRLRSLELTGGSTPTILPAAGSPALDAGMANGLTTDQRGYARTVGIRSVDPAPDSDRTDIGAAELRFPRVRFQSGPRGTITRRNVRIAFDSDTPGASFRCSFNFKDFEECTSPFRGRSLREGYHQLQVRAYTDDGLLGRLAKRDFVIDTELKRPKVKAKRVQRLRGRRVKVRVDMSAREDVVIKARGFVRVAGLGRLPLKRKKLALPGHRVKRLNLEPRSKRSARRILKAAKKRRKVVAKVRVTMVDRGSHRFRKRVKVRLKR